MLNLRERAHATLAQFRNTPPSRQGTLQSEPNSPADDNDELAVLGGRTRLAAPKEKSVSPILGNFSPTSANPIVPFPIKSDHLDGQAHPVTLEYLRTFVSHPRAQQQAQPQLPSPFNPSVFAEMTPVSSTSSNFSPTSVQFTSQQISPLEMHHQGLPQTLPQYFPVFDYGYAGNADAFTNVSINESDMSGRSYSPESTMQNAWQDFVAQIGQM